MPDHTYELQDTHGENRLLTEHVASLQADNAELVALVGTLKLYVSEAQHMLHESSTALRTTRETNRALRERYTRSQVVEIER